MNKSRRQHFSVWLALILSLLLFSCVTAVKEKKVAEPEYSITSWPHEKSDIKPDPSLVFGRLENGFRYVLKKNSEPKDRVAMHLEVFAGSLFEREEQRGIAHFLEHMLFNGSENYAPGELVKRLQKMGMEFGPDANAHTGFHNTVYNIMLPRGTEKDIKDALIIFKDYAKGALLLRSEVEKEKKVVLSEMTTRDSVSYRTFAAVLKFLLPDTLVSERLPIGKREAIEKADGKLLKDFYDTWYGPKRMILVMTGDFDPVFAEGKIKETFAGLKQRAPEKTPRDMGSVEHKGIKALWHHEKEAGSTRVSIQVVKRSEKEVPGREDLKAILERDMADAVVQNRLNHMLEESGTPFTAASISSGIFMKGVEYTRITAETEPEKWRRTLELLEQTLRSALTRGFYASEVERVKKDLAANLELRVKQAATRKSGAIARSIVSSLNHDRVMTSPQQDLELYAPLIDSLTVEEVFNAFMDTWQNEARLILVTGNAVVEKTGNSHEATIVEAFEKSGGVAVAMPFERRPVGFPYLRKPGRPGGMVTTDTVKDLDVTRVDFANGLLLNMKKTDFDANRIIFSLAFGDGRASEPKPGLSFLAEAIVNESGTGTLPERELERALAGKNTWVEFSVDPDSFKFSGVTEPGETELMFQLLHTRLRDPGFRRRAWQNSMKRFKQMYAALSHRTQGAVHLHMTRFLAGGDTRFGYPPYEDFMKYTLNDVKSWLRPAFRKNRLELSVAGDFDPEKIIRYASLYLGGLPRGKAPATSGLIRGPVFPEGQTRIFELETKIEKSAVFVSYPTDDFLNIQQARRLNMLADVFSDRLRDIVREKKGLAYSAYAYNRSSVVYEDYGVFTATASVNKGDEQRTVDAILQITDDMVKNGITDDELTRAKKPVLTRLKDMARTNRYWLNMVLSGSTRIPAKLDWAGSVWSDYSSITLEEMNACAKKFLENSKAVAVIIKQAEPRGE